MKKLCAVVLLGASLLFAADEPIDQTFRLDNGRFWSSTEPESRHAYMRGLIEGWKLREIPCRGYLGQVPKCFLCNRQVQY